jgi:hypothetical protein
MVEMLELSLEDAELLKTAEGREGLVRWVFEYITEISGQDEVWRLLFIELRKLTLPAEQQDLDLLFDYFLMEKPSMRGLANKTAQKRKKCHTPNGAEIKQQQIRKV